MCNATWINLQAYIAKQTAPFAMELSSPATDELKNVQRIQASFSTRENGGGNEHGAGTRELSASVSLVQSPKNSRSTSSVGEGAEHPAAAAASTTEAGTTTDDHFPTTQEQEREQEQQQKKPSASHRSSREEVGRRLIEEDHVDRGFRPPYYGDIGARSSDEGAVSPVMWTGGSFGGDSNSGRDGNESASSDFDWDRASPTEPLSPTLQGVHRVAVEVMRRSFGSMEEGELPNNETQVGRLLRCRFSSTCKSKMHHERHDGTGPEMV